MMVDDCLQVADREIAPAPPQAKAAPTALQCAACGGVAFQRLFQKAGRDFWNCRQCGMQRQYPLPSLDELKRYYDESYREGLYKEFAAAGEMKRLTAETRWAAIRDHVPQGRWLDVGCADGTFLTELVRHGIEATGIDLSEVAVRKAVERGHRAYCETVEAHSPATAYDVVTAFDVLEHVVDPGEFLSDVHRLLAPQGLLVLSTPNLRSLSRFIMRRRWYFYIPEEHLFYFAPRSLEKLLQRNGYTLISCWPSGKPLTFDYSLSQFREYNPLIYRALSIAGAVVPSRWRNVPIQMRIGEMLAIARRQ